MCRARPAAASASSTARAALPWPGAGRTPADRPGACNRLPRPARRRSATHAAARARRAAGGPPISGWNVQSQRSRPENTMMPAIRPLNSSDEVTDLIARALAEDVGPGDITTEALIDPDRRARARIEQKQAGVVFGIEVAEAVFRSLDPSLEWSPVRGEGEWLSHPPATVVQIAAQTRALLTGERVALNFLQHLSGIATAAAQAAHELRGTQAKVLDTRKTTPGLRALEKQAVAAGGGHNHRMGLYDAILIKDNHIAMGGGVAAATARALQTRPPGCTVEVECSDLGDVEEA